MRDILDPADLWVGIPGTVSVFGDKRPVAIADTLSVLMDSGPVTVDVLANDFDPEGGPLTLVSANASFGSAVAETDDTVTYTPLPGFSGFDTILYEIADDQDQRRTGQVNITVTEPQLSITTLPGNTLQVNAETGTLDITVNSPAAFAGVYTVSTSDLATGPVNLVPPTISGTVATGQTMSAVPGLWVYDTGAGVPVSGWQWRRAGADIAGATGDSYVVQAGDSIQGLSVTNTETDSFGQRSATSPTVGSVFTPADDTALLGWWDGDDAATISHTAGAVWGWADKAGGTALEQANNARRPSTALRTINGRNALDFDGSAFLERAETLPGSGDVAFHMVVSIDSTASAFEAILAIEATNDFQIDSNLSTQFDGRLNMTGIGSPANLSGGPFAGAMILSAVFDRTGSATAQVFISDVSRVSAAYTTSIDTAATLVVMANRAKNAWVDGAIGELIVTGDVTNRAQHHAYLATKWGLV